MLYAPYFLKDIYSKFAILLYHNGMWNVLIDNDLRHHNILKRLRAHAPCFRRGRLMRPYSWQRLTDSCFHRNGVCIVVMQLWLHKLCVLCAK